MDTALTLTNDMKLVLGLVGFTMAMFLFERIRADVVALIVLVVLGVTGLVAPEELFGGFSGNAVMSIIATTILGAGLERTGALNRLATWLLRRSHGSEQRLMMMTLAISGLNSSFMQNPSVMALYLPVASRLAARTGLTLQRMLLPIAAAIVMGGALTMVGNSPLILLNDLLVSANNNLPSGMASIEPLTMFAPLPIGVALLIAALLYFRFYGDRKLIEEEQLINEGVTPSRTESYFAKTYGIDGDVFELIVTAESPLVGMTLGEAEALHDAPLLLALKTGNDTRLAPPADMRIWVGSVLGAMGPRQEVADFAQNQFLRMSSRLRNLGDLFNPSLAGISEAVIPPNSRLIGKSAAELRLRKQAGISLLAINRDKQVIREDVAQRAVARRRHAGLPQHLAGPGAGCGKPRFRAGDRLSQRRTAPAQVQDRDGDLRLHHPDCIDLAPAGGADADDRRGLHAGQRRVAHGRGLRIDQLENHLHDGRPDSAGLGDGQQWYCCLGRRPHHRSPARRHPGVGAGNQPGVADHCVLAGDQPCRRDHRDGADCGQSGAGGQRQPDRVCPDRGVVGVQ